MAIVTLRLLPRVRGLVVLATAEIMAGVTLAHTWAGGALPAVPYLIGLSALVYAATSVALRGRVRLLPMAAGVAAAQVGLHHLLSAMSPVSHAHHEMGALPHAGWSWPMVAAHAASALLTLLVWLTRRRLWRAVVSWPRAVAVRPATLRPAPLHAVRRALAIGVLPHDAPRRGPPRALRPA